MNALFSRLLCHGATSIPLDLLGVPVAGAPFRLPTCGGSPARLHLDHGLAPYSHASSPADADGNTHAAANYHIITLSRSDRGAAQGHCHHRHLEWPFELQLRPWPGLSV